MRTRILSLGRRIAIAVCMALALVTGTLSVVLPQLNKMSAAGYESISVTTDLTEIERGLDGLDSEVLAQLKTHLTVKDENENDVPAANYTVESVSYNANTATITVSAPGVAGDPVENSVIVLNTFEAGNPNIDVVVNPDKAALVNGVYKVKDASGNATNQTVFLTTRSSEEILTYLNVSLRYTNLSVPMTVVAEGETPSKLGEVVSCRIFQNEFDAGEQEIDVQVYLTAGGDEFRPSSPLRVTFEDVKVVDFTATPKDTLYSYSDIVSSFTVTATYNDGRENEVVSEREISSFSTLLPTAEILSGFTYDNTLKTKNASNGTPSRATDTPATLSTNTYSKPIMITCGGITKEIPASDITIQLANPYSIVGIVGVPVIQQIDQAVKLDGLSIVTSYATDFKDEVTHVGLDGIGGGNIISSVFINSSVMITTPLKDVSDCVEVSFTGAADSYESALTATVPENASRIYLRYTYAGQMFYFVSSVYKQGAASYRANWETNKNVAENNFAITLEGSSGPSIEANYIERPVFDERNQTYTEGLTKSFLNLNLNEVLSLIGETGLTITATEKTRGSLTYTYRMVGNSIQMTTGENNNPAEVGLTYQYTNGAYSFLITRPGSYTITATLPETGANGLPNYFYGTTENVATYTFEIAKSNLSVFYTGATFTGTGLTLPQGSLANSLTNLGVLFSAGGNFVSQNLPENYTVYIRKATAAASTAIPVLHYQNGARVALSADEIVALNHLDDVINAQYLLHIVYDGNDFYRGQNDVQNTTTLTVIRPDIGTLGPQMIAYNPAQTAKSVIDNWTESLGGEDSAYTVSLTDGEGVAIAGNEVLHKNGTYYLVFTPKTSGSPKSVTLTVTAWNYPIVETTYAAGFEYSKVDGALILKAAQDAYAATKDDVYYVFDGTTKGEFRRFENPETGATTTSASALTAGNWVAVYATVLGENAEEGDYNTPYIRVAFTVAKLPVTLTEASGNDFTTTDYAADYTSGALNFVLEGWSEAARSNIGYTITAHLFDGTTTITESLYGLDFADEKFSFAAYTAGIYTIAFTKNADTDNVAFTNVSYTLTVNKVAATIAQTGSVEQGSDPVVQITGVSSDEAVLAKEGLKIGSYTYYKNSDGTVEVAPDDLETGTTYYLKVNTLTGEYVETVSGISYQATFTYAVNYTIPTGLVAISVTQGKLPQLQVRPAFTNDLRPVENVENEYLLAVSQGTAVNVLTYFRNVSDDDYYNINVTKVNGETASYAMNSLAEQLMRGELDEGEYTIEISPDNTRFQWEDADAKNLVIHLTVVNYQLTGKYYFGGYSDTNGTEITLSTLFSSIQADEEVNINFETATYRYVNTSGAVQTIDLDGFKALPAGRYTITIVDGSMSFSAALTVDPRPVKLKVVGSLVYGSGNLVIAADGVTVTSTLQFESGLVPQFALTAAGAAMNVGNQKGSTWLTLANADEFENYSVSFEIDSELNVTHATAKFAPSFTFVYGANLENTYSLTAANLTFTVNDREGVTTLGTITGNAVYTVDENGNVTFVLHDLENENYVFVRNEEFTAYQTFKLTVSGTDSLEYDRTSKTLASATANEGDTVYYSSQVKATAETEALPLAGIKNLTEWSTLARETSAGTYFVYYYVDVSGYGRVYGQTPVEVTIAKSDNTLATDFQLANGTIVKESGAAKEAWTYGNFNANGEQRITTPVAEFGGSVTYALYLGDATEPMDTSSDISAVLSSMQANKLEAGNYRLTAKTTDSANYNAFTTTYYFNVGKATLTVKADDKTVVYGDELPVLTYSVTGLNSFVTTDTAASVLNGVTVTLDGSAYQKGDNAGSYNIILNVTGESEVKNYTLVKENGTLTVNKRALTVKINSVTVGYKATEQSDDVPLDHLTAELISGSLYRTEENGVTGIDSIIDLHVKDVTFPTDGGELDASVGSYPIYATWKDGMATNYAIAFEGCDYNVAFTPETEDAATLVGEGKAFSAGTFTVTKVFVNVVWSSNNRSFVYNGSSISLSAVSTTYARSDGSYGTFEPEKELVLSWEKLNEDGSVTQPMDDEALSLPVHAGTYKVYADMSDTTNYTTGGAYIVIIIERATFEVKVGNAVVTYGDTIDNATTAPSYSYDSTKVFQGDVTEINTKLAAATYAVEERDSEGAIIPINKLGVGLYTLSLTDINLADYNVIISYGTLRVERRAVTVSLNSFSAKYKGSAYTQADLGEVTVEQGDVFTVSNAPSNGDAMDTDTLRITISITGNAVNVGTYNISARAANDRNYLVTFADNTATFTITKATLTVSTVVDVVYGSDTVSAAHYTFTGFCGTDDYETLSTVLVGETTLVTDAPEYTLVFNGATLGSEYTLTRKTGTGFSFLNYEINESTGYTETYHILKRTLSVSFAEGETPYVYTGSAVEPQFAFANAVTGETIAFTASYAAKAGSALTEGKIVDAGDYSVTLVLQGAYAEHYQFENETAQSVIDLTVHRQTIRLNWAQNTIVYDRNTTQLNQLTGYDKNVADLIANKGGFTFVRKFMVYTSQGGNEGIGHEETQNLSLQTTEPYYSVALRGVGEYTLTLTLNADGAKNYEFVTTEGGSNTVTLQFNVTSTEVNMVVTVAEKEYDGNPAVETIAIEGTVLSSGWMQYVTRTYASVTKAQAEDLKKLDRITASDASQFTFGPSAPVNAGYYLLHVVYFRNVAQGVEGADVYVLYRISPRVISTAPAFETTPVFEENEEGELVQVGETPVTTANFNGGAREFKVFITDENAIKLFKAYSNVVRITGVDANNHAISADITFDVKEEDDGTLTLTAVAVYAGSYTIAFHLPDGNYEWKEYVQIGGGSENEGDSPVYEGIEVNADGDFVLSFSITPYFIEVEDETEETNANQTFGGDYTQAIRDSLKARKIPDFVNLDNIRVSYAEWREDDSYVGVDWFLTPSAVGKYYYSVYIEGTANYNVAYLNGTLDVSKKEVSVTVIANQTYGGDVTFTPDSFSFDGFVGNDEASSLLAIDVSQIRYNLDLNGISASNYSQGGVLLVGTYGGVIELVMGSDGNILGFSASGDEDNYVYVFNKKDSALNVTPYSITVTIGNSSSPFGSPINQSGITLSTGNTMPEDASNLRTLLGVSFVLGAGSTSKAGSYALSATASNPNYNVTFINGVYTITPIAVSISFNSDRGGVYGGTITGTRLASVSSAESPDLGRRDIEDYIVYRYTGTTNAGVAYDEYDVPTQAGTYTVTAEIDPARTGNFTLIGSVSAIFTIDKMSIDVTQLHADELVYTGRNQRPVIASNQYEAYYGYDSYTTFNEAGTYSLTLTILDSNNVQWSTGGNTYPLSVVVAKAQNRVLDISIEGWKYGEKANLPKAELQYPVDENLISYEYLVNGEWTSVAPTNAGTYSVRVSVAESNNYAALTDTRVATFEISKKEVKNVTLNVVHEGEGKNDTYTGGILSSLVQGYDAALMSFTRADYINIQEGVVTLNTTNAGTYLISITLLDADNYMWETDDEDGDGAITLTWVIAKKAIKKPTANNTNYIVNGDILTYIPEGFDSEIMGIRNNEIGYSGKFEVEVYLLDPDNYEWAVTPDSSEDRLADLTFDWTVSGADIIFVAIISGVAGVAVIAGAALLIQMGVHNKKKKREAAEMEAADGNDADNAGEGV